MVAAGRISDHLPPSGEESAQAREARRVLSKYIHRAGVLQLEAGGNERREVVPLPSRAAHLLMDLLAEMAEGNAVALLPMQAELTTQQAADLLNVSRPYLVKLMDGGAIGHRKVGTHRRVLLGELLAYRQRRDRERAIALDELARQGQELDMAFDGSTR